MTTLKLGDKMKSIPMASNFRRCDCESNDCHPNADCQKPAEIRTTHSKICGDCAKKMPAKYLLESI